MSEKRHRPFARVVADNLPMIYHHPDIPEICGVEVTTIQKKTGKTQQLVRFLTPEELAQPKKLLTRRRLRD